MLTVNKLIPQGRGLASVLLKRAATVALDWDVRQKSRFDATDSQGRTLGVFLPRGTAVRGGDVLVVRACAEHGTAFDLLRAAYHLGNRHVALELKPDHLKLEPDHVLADMLRQQHLIVTETSEAFEPEGGAYGQAGHGHGHGHEHSHAAAHAPAAAPRGSAALAAIPVQGAGHVHGPGCRHDHGDHGGHQH